MPTPTTPAVEVVGLVKRYRRTTAVAGLDLVAPRGSLTAVLGPNGAGKTTTVECCEGLRRPDGGTVRVLGLDPAIDGHLLRHRVGVMLQDGGLPAGVPAGEVLDHVARMHDRPAPVAPLAARLGIDAFARTHVRRLSGGQQRRLALACAVVGRPELVFLDEPTAGLDPQARLAVRELVVELRSRGTSIVLTTHHIAEAAELADHVVIVDRGVALAAGSPASLVGDDDVLRLTVRADDRSGDRRGPPVTELCAALASALGRRAEVSTTPDGALEVHAALDPSLVHAVTGWAAQSGLLVQALSTGSRSLEDVVLDLTGRELR